jgi:hypothetical protein
VPGQKVRRESGFASNAGPSCLLMAPSRSLTKIKTGRLDFGAQRSSERVSGSCPFVGKICGAAENSITGFKIFSFRRENNRCYFKRLRCADKIISALNDQG